ncbi:hypothetical protein ACNHJL_13050 [Klebsiella pneumoniae]|uniref:hypothetical protein n=1 Tax=Klebsiella pneumoniae TaxID=573 RepID=UPI0021004E47|nr:hypothetical protein [Klebsiella pneumoniae]MDG0646966.1 hypothetical protein [Klebsiella pneumoniae]
MNVKQHQLWDSEAPQPPPSGGGNFATGMLIFTEAGEEKFFISGLEKRALDIILYSGQAMLAFMLSF